MEEMLEKEEHPAEVHPEEGEDDFPWDLDLPGAESSENAASGDKPAVKGVRPAEGMPLPEKGFGSLTLRERAAFFREDPEGYKRARNVF